VTLLGMVISPTIVASGGTATGTITLSGPTAQAAVIALASSNASIASVPATVPAGAGATQVSFPITTGAAGAATITATFGNSVPATITVVKTKDKEKEKEKEVIDKVVKEKELEKITVEKRATLEFFADGQGLLLTTVARLDGSNDTSSVVPTRRAFIRPDERPAAPIPM
jgi:hypothetical protein